MKRLWRWIADRIPIEQVDYPRDNPEYVDDRYMQSLDHSAQWRRFNDRTIALARDGYVFVFDDKYCHCFTKFPWQYVIRARLAIGAWQSRRNVRRLVPDFVKAMGEPNDFMDDE